LSAESELQRVKSLIKQLNISPNKNLGQNFLINENKIKLIIDTANTKGQSVVEIGPGLGALTTQLTLNCNKLLLVEFDKKLSEYWVNKGLNVENQDALKKNWSELNSEYKTLVSNLPYDISAPLVVKLSSEPSPFLKMVLMFQKEVAQRIAATIDNKKYGLISVVAQNVWNIKKVADFNARDFHPSPKIESRTLLFTKKEDAFINSGFLKFVKHCFLNRRKMLIKNLKSFSHSKNIDEEKLFTIMSDLAIDAKSRPENVAPLIYRKLYIALEKE